MIIWKSFKKCKASLIFSNVNLTLPHFVEYRAIPHKYHWLAPPIRGRIFALELFIERMWHKPLIDRIFYVVVISLKNANK